MFKIEWQPKDGEKEVIESDIADREEAERLVNEYAIAFHTSTAAFTILEESEG